MSPTAAPRVPLRPSPYTIKPPYAVDFNRAVSVDVAAGASVAPGELVAELPANSVGVIRSLFLGYENTSTTLPSASFTLRLGNPPVPIEGWSDLRLQFAGGGTGNFQLRDFKPFETWIWNPAGRRFSVRLAVIGSDGLRLGCAYHGWFFPKQYALAGWAA